MKNNQLVRIEFCINESDSKYLIGSDSKNTVCVVFIDKNDFENEQDLIWHYENKWCSADLFEYMDVESVFIGDKESSIKDLMERMGITEAHLDENTWGFTRRVKASLVKTVN